MSALACHTQDVIRFRGVAAFFDGMLLRWLRRKGVRCHRWGKPSICRFNDPWKHGLP
jgi:hypothetical protein